MSVFTRSNSGIANYNLFHASDFTVFIEGKITEQTEGQTTVVDIYYYEYLLTAASGGRKPKIKCVGNKKAALDYATKIRAGDIPRAAVIVDKDLEGVISSQLSINPIIQTFGYSWENELWSANTIKNVLYNLTNNVAKVDSEVDMYLHRMSYRLKYVSLLDAAMQTNGEAILNKKSALCGIPFTYPIVKAKDITRISQKYKNSPASSCSIASDVIKNNLNADARKIIQGHFWSNMAARFITTLYKKLGGDSNLSNALLTNIALSNMRRDPKLTVGEDLVDRYAAELQRIGI